MPPPPAVTVAAAPHSGVKVRDAPIDIHSDAVVSESDAEYTVLVTGYGPFLDKFPINASWSVASTLPTYLPPTPSAPYRIRIVVPPHPLRVAYAHVASQTPKLLSGGGLRSNSTGDSPALLTSKTPYTAILHIGLAAGRDYYTLERQSLCGPYNRLKDVDGHVLPDSEAQKLFAHCPEVLKPTFDMADVWRRWRDNVPEAEGADLRPSDDPGTYLCGFIYYLSMSWFYRQGLKDEKMVERPVVFLHVPDLPTEEDVAQGRAVAIGLVRALVASRVKRGVRDPLKEDKDEDGDDGNEGVERVVWDGVSAE